MSEIDPMAYAKWEGAAQAFSNAVIKAHGTMISKSKGEKHQSGLSAYGNIRGYSADYSDYLNRIESVIKLMKKAKNLFIEAESLRKQIDRAN